MGRARINDVCFAGESPQLIWNLSWIMIHAANEGSWTRSWFI